MSAADPISFNEFNKTLDSASARFSGRIGSIKQLIAGKHVYLFGYGGKGRALATHIAKNFDIRVIVYDSNVGAIDMASRDGFSVITSLEGAYDKGHGIILGACQSQLEQAALAGQNHIYYEEAAFLFDAPLLANMVRGYPRWVVDNKAGLYRLYTSLASESRPTLLDVLRFRLSLDPHDLTSSRKPNADMWFDVIERYSSRKYSTFLDVGAYNGDTLLQAERRLAVARGIAVEANTSLFESIRRVGSSYEKGVEIVPRAAWSHSCRLHFSEVRGGMISVSESPDGELEAGPIDEYVGEGVDLLKMDIEGAEIPALQGCRQLLKAAPDLALAAYHRPDDLLRIPAFLEGAGYTTRTFDMHIAHYSDCLDDTILYFLKRRGSVEEEE